jgi:hypothetical protein
VDVATRVDDEVRRLSLERPRGVYQDLLQHLFTDVGVERPASLALCMGISEPRDVGAARGHGVEETGTADATGDASSASGLAVSASAPTSVTLFTGSLT